jgi:uncharacterized protein YbjQ (UPF0145 family)
MKDSSHLSKIIPISTVDKIYGYEIDEHIGIIIMSASSSGGIIADFKSSWADFFGMRSRTYEKKFDEYINEGLEGLRQRALEMGANGIIGFRCESESVQAGKSMVIYTLVGTAVRCHKSSINNVLNQAGQEGANSGTSSPTVARIAK